MTHNRYAILVVEDNNLIRMLAVDILVNAGFKVFEAETADEAIRILQSRSDINLVFTDVQMPGTMDGIKLCHYIRYRWPPIKLIVASGEAMLNKNHLPVGTSFFAKPYNHGAIIANIEGMLALSK